MKWIIREPLTAIEWVLAGIAIAYALLLCVPVYNPVNSALPVLQLVGVDLYLSAVWIGGAALPSLWGLCRKNLDARRYGTFSLFFMWLFFSLYRFIEAPSLYFLALLGLALVAGICNLALSNAKNNP